MAKQKGDAKSKAKKGGGNAAKAGADKDGASKPDTKISGKEYDKELRKLHVEHDEVAGLLAQQPQRRWCIAYTNSPMSGAFKDAAQTFARR